MQFVIITRSEDSDAGMAQSVEHVIGNDEVISSILITSSKKNRFAEWQVDSSFYGSIVNLLMTKVTSNFTITNNKKGSTSSAAIIKEAL